MIELRIKDTDRAIDEAVRKGMLALGAGIIAQAKLLAPVDKGILRNSLMYRGESFEGGFNESSGQKASTKITPVPKVKWEVYLGSNLPYAVYQEFGTRRSAPNPYLRPAIALGVGKSKEEVKQNIRKEMSLGVLKEGREKVRFF